MESISSIFPADPGLFSDQSKSIEIILETYVKDAYHSLSIEGYHVTEELIQKIANGNWDPESLGSDKQQMEAMAAKGYSISFDAVIESVRKILEGKMPGTVLEEDLQTWYRELFIPLFKANVLDQDRIGGFRNNLSIRSNQEEQIHYLTVEEWSDFNHFFRKLNPRRKCLTNDQSEIFYHPCY